MNEQGEELERENCAIKGCERKHFTKLKTFKDEAMTIPAKSFPVCSVHVEQIKYGLDIT